MIIEDSKIDQKKFSECWHKDQQHVWNSSMLEYYVKWIDHDIGINLALFFSVIAFIYLSIWVKY